MEPRAPLPTPNTYVASTADVAGADKFDYWHDVVSRSVVDLDVQRAAGTLFDATIEGVRLGDLNVWRIDALPHTAARSAAGISRASTDSFVFNFVVSGQLRAHQDGKDVLLGSGDGTLCDANRPYLLDIREPVSIACVKLPHAALSSRSVGLQRATALSFEHVATLCPLVFGYLVNLTRHGAQLSQSSSDKAVRNFTELLGAMVDEVVVATPLPLSEYRAVALLRVKEYVELRLGDSELGSAQVSSDLKLSPRYINELMSAEKTSLGRYIWRRRLERAAADLGNPALVCRNVSAIAMTHGFNDLSHFSKSFRQTFGASPRDFRAEALVIGGDI